MNSRALIGAVGGAILGAIIWGGIAYATGYEVGYIAWGIGILVGGGAKLLGGSDRATGVACAVLALAAIFVGKMLAVELSAPAEIRKIAENAFTQDQYEVIQKDAEDFSKLTSEVQYAQFMSTHDFRKPDASGPVSADEITEFKNETAPSLRQFHAEKPGFQEWRKQQLDEIEASVARKLPLFEMVVGNLGVIDIVFALLGVVTAFKLGSGETQSGAFPQRLLSADEQGRHKQGRPQRRRYKQSRDREGADEGPNPYPHPFYGAAY